MESRRDASLQIEEDEALEFYSRLSGNPIRESDRRVREELLQFDPTTIKVGVVLSILRCKNHVHSLKYCRGAIEEAARSPREGRELYLRYLMSKVDRI